ncbi:Coiled-coil domain-containing protein 40 [Phytophthora boehmeriae]|uniref:Coiled-coil domain-containing protein 40 n=1 Tax=Phytophthora boehmeriae TaxID=109152 RepID=A0A8T1X5W6_9STRA|nr:Coiled-coil domain-containing protein 40 [Phytophthora boehmeriae]
MKNDFAVGGYEPAIDDAAQQEPAESEDVDNDSARDDEDDEDDDSDDDDDESDDEEEDPTQTIVDMGRHERMQRIQKVLYEQLVGNDERLSLELREKEEELRRAKTAREDVGVALYGVQQQLAQLQVALESAHRRLTTLHDERFTSEDKLDEWKASAEEKRLAVERRRAHLQKTQSELDSLNMTLRQVEKYNEEMKHEIARTQRAAEKAEESMTAAEKDKVKQDLYIDRLNEQVKSLQDQLAANGSQLKTQRLETQAAEETLREASEQMEAVAFEKKQLLQQWKSALIGMQQRDTALQATQSAISKVGEEELALGAELRGYKISIEKAQQAHETLIATIERFNAELRFVEEQTENLRGEHERLTARHELLTKSLKQTEAQVSAATSAGKKLESEAAQVAQHLETTQRERHLLEDEIAAEKNDQTTVHKAAHNLTKETQRLVSRVHEKEVDLANLQNEMARVGVDALNVQNHIAQLMEAQRALVEELKRDDQQVERAELEIRQRNDEIEKKMLRLDRLNKKYEQLVSKMEDADTGPLEATIKNLVRETKIGREENTAKQKQWLNTQTALVHTASETQELSERTQERKSKTSVLEQKQLRLQHELHEMQRELRELSNGIASLHADTGRLNELISRQGSKHDDLLNSNHALELEFTRELRELEATSVAMEARAGTLRQEKQELLNRVIEVERQLMLWEKKIQLEKETQAALDPEVGQAEARSMEKEIHRMRLRLEALQRSQEQMLQDMEQAVHKRDVIALRGRSKKEQEADLTFAALTAKVSTLQNQLRKSERDAARLDKSIRSQLVAGEDVSFQLEKVSAELKVGEEAALSLQRAINAALYDKQRYIDAAARKLRMAKRFDSLCRGVSNGPPNEAKAAEALEKAAEGIEKVRTIVDLLQKQNPHLAEVLPRVLLLAEDPPPIDK